MKNLSKQIESFIDEELLLINQKLTGLVLLDILKYKLLEKLKKYIEDIDLDYTENLSEESNIENVTNKFLMKISNYHSKKIKLTSNLDNDTLFISIKEISNIRIEDDLTKKDFTFKCIPMTGVIISKGSNCSFNYPKGSIFLELSLLENIVEKNKESTI